MPKYPTIWNDSPGHIFDDDDQVVLDCGCALVVSADATPGIEGSMVSLFYCAMHQVAQELLDALDTVTEAAYRDFAADAIGCVFCELGVPGPGDRPWEREHGDMPDGEACPMDRVHDVIRKAKGGTSP